MNPRSVEIGHLAVVVPARNEAATIEACIQSLHVARRRLGNAATTSLVIVADSCSDDTVSRALSAIDPARDLVVTCVARTAGGARRAGAALALQRADGLASTWLCATDADSTVAADWLTTHLELAERGVVAVAGVVHLAGDATESVREVFGRTYHTNVDGTHPHVHGTNLGCRADAYLAVGGWAPLATAEDHDLWRRLSAVGDTLSSDRLVVTTSGRTTGRAPDGFAATLLSLVGDEVPAT